MFNVYVCFPYAAARLASFLPSVRRRCLYYSCRGQRRVRTVARRVISTAGRRQTTSRPRNRADADR